MDKRQLQHYRDQLLELRSRLEDDIHNVDRARVESTVRPTELSDVPTHNADRDSEGLDVNLAVDATLREELRAINEALERIVNGSYGKCQSCNQPIAKERLDALPYAAFCVSCEEESEKSDRGRGPRTR